TCAAHGRPPPEWRDPGASRAPRGRPPASKAYRQREYVLSVRQGREAPARNVAAAARLARGPYPRERTEWRMLDNSQRRRAREREPNNGACGAVRPGNARPPPCRACAGFAWLAHHVSDEASR